MSLMSRCATCWPSRRSRPSSPGCAPYATSSATSPPPTVAPCRPRRLSGCTRTAGSATSTRARRVRSLMSTALELADWRRKVAMLYASVRACPDPAEGHALWRSGRDALFRDHPQSPLAADHPMRDTGVPYWPYDPAYRFELPLLSLPVEDDEIVRVVPTSADGDVRQRLVGRVALPAPVGGTLDVWWLHQYAG